MKSSFYKHETNNLGKWFEIPLKLDMLMRHSLNNPHKFALLLVTTNSHVPDSKSDTLQFDLIKLI